MPVEKEKSLPARPHWRTRDLRLAVRIGAKPAQVYSALTSARELCRWWLAGAETDARNAGRLRMVWPKRQGRRDVFGEREGCFVDLEPGSKVSWLWRCNHRHKLVPSLCTFFILRQKRGCEVLLLHAGFSSRPAADRVYGGFARGWEDALTKLKLYLETGRTCKNELLAFVDLPALLKPRKQPPV
ncbi:MAG TPA: hypothetical protein DEB40_10410 [Elusimicrobia bacterium]|nr:hypothetical protein [Elusimicrobiota bacterium]HBT62142.1 hypothetical protein [Elusimicrobiota bacterium]